MSVDATHALTTPIERELRDEFPGWWIRHCESGCWRAIRGNRHVAADTPADLQMKLRAADHPER
ncbi:MAG: hypothetical protein ACRDN9_16405 [Streptosporangiaceae bacterium]